MQTKEHLLHFLLGGEIHLSKNDYSFFYNVQNLIKVNKFITTNQAKLLDKLLHKYSRQLNKSGKKVDELLQLPWKCEVKPSLDEYTKAHLSVSENFIYIRSPFNKNFVKEIKNDTVANFIWNKETKLYTAPFTTYSFKYAVDLCKKYHILVLCNASAQLLQDLENYENTIWDPTLVNKNGYFYIAALNEFLYEVTRDLDLNLSPKSLTLLAQFGVKTYTLDDAKLQFCSSMISTVDSGELETICDWLLESDIKYVHVYTQLANKKFYSECKKVFQSKGLITLSSEEVRTTDKPYVLIKSTSYYEYHREKINLGYPSKVIILKNSNPITVR